MDPQELEQLAKQMAQSEFKPSIALVTQNEELMQTRAIKQSQQQENYIRQQLANQQQLYASQNQLGVFSEQQQVRQPLYQG